MHTNAANLSFTSNKHCFLCLPKSWKLKSSDTKLVVLEVRGQDGFVYTAWSGDVQAKHNEEEKVGLSGLFASKHGLKDDETVLVKTVDNVVSCERVEVEPLSVDDWEIMELNASYIANNMLNQVRVVWPGQIVPLWIQKSVCIFVKIGSMEPNGPCSMLVERTQVLIQPKSKGFSNTSSQNTHSVTQGSTGQNTGSVPSSSQNKNSGTKPKQNKIGHRKSKSALNGTDSNSQIANKINKSQSNTNTAALNKSSETSISDNQQGLISSFVSYISSFWSSPVLNLKANEQSVNFEEYLGKQIEAKLRIQGITYFIDTGSCVTNSENTNRLDFSDVLELRPDTVYVGSDTLECMFSGKVYSDDNFGAKNRRQSFLVSLKKLPSPAETEEIMRKKMEKQGKSRRPGSGTGAELDQTSGIQNVDTFPPENETSPVIVRVVVLQSGKHCTKSFIKQISSVQNVNNSAESSAETTENLQESAEKFESREQNVGLCYEKHILCGHIVFHNLLRRQMSVDLTGSVKIETISPEVKPSQPNEIRLHPLFTIPDGFTNDMLIVAFKSYIETTTSAAFPLVVSQGILIKCVLKPDFHGEFLVTFPSQVNDLKQKSEFVILCKQTLEQLKVKVTKEKPEVVKQLPLWSLEQIDPHLPEKSVEQLGGVADLVTSCISHTELTLSQKPLAKYVLKKAHPMSNGGLLISGGRGIGKSCLVKAVCREVSGYPNLAYCVIVDCKQLKGKRVDSIRRHMEKAINEAAWRQPAVVVLEDLDVVCAAPSGPEQEMSGEALYYTRVAEVVKDILKLELTQGTRLAVIATVRNRSSLHNTLSVGSGNHMFHKVITMDPPDKIQRAAILKALMLNKPLLAHTVTESIDISSIANQTEGYVARDLETVVERAIHVCMMKSTETGRTIEKEIKLSDEDFRAALKDFTPSSLRNVTLHTPSDTCWEDVGGLVEVKNTLVETLQWPSKYPVLFASCPLRLRSGILLYGAPGTGKTLLAGVVAKECGLNFISIKGPELLSKYIGASEQAVRDTFVRAQSAKPCILFFDEFDSLAPRRGHDSTGVTDRVVNQLLTQLDGVEGLDGVYVLGATSRPDLIDPALLRPGRLDKALHCPLPTKEERYEILGALTRSMNLADDVNLTTIANTTNFFTGADFKALLYNAQLNAIHDVTPGLGTEGSERETVTLNNEPDKRVDRSAILKEEPNSGNGEMVRSDEENVEHKLKRELSAMSTGSWEKVNFSNKESFENIAQNHPTAESSQTELKTTLDTLLFKDDLNLESNKGTGVKDDSNLGVKGDTEVKVMEKIPDKRIVYIPSLEDGPQDLDSEEEGRLYEKVKHYIEDTPEVEDKAKKPISIQIQQRHLEAALQGMGPSVSEKERRKYKRIYENFVGSRGGNFSDGTQTVGKKATLA